MVSYLGVVNNYTDDALLIDLNSSLEISQWLTLYPDDTPVYSIEFIDPAIEEKYSSYLTIDSATGILEIRTATGVVLPEDTKLEMVEFIAKATTSRVTVASNTNFYFHSNSWNSQADFDTLDTDITLALTDINSISFYAAWGRSIK